MNLQDLTLKQIKAVESVLYQRTFIFTDSDFFEFINMLITECHDDNPEIELDDDGTRLLIDGELSPWFENEISRRAVEGA